VQSLGRRDRSQQKMARAHDQRQGVKERVEQHRPFSACPLISDAPVERCKPSPVRFIPQWRLSSRLGVYYMIHSTRAAASGHTGCVLPDRSGRRAGPRLAESVPVSDRRAIGRDLAVVQYGWPVGMPLLPLIRRLDYGEVRSNLPSRRIARILFFIHQGRIGVVHGFAKKIQRTPPDDLALARRRMQE